MSILGWVAVGVVTAFLFGWIMPVNNGRIRARIIIGVAAAITGGALVLIGMGQSFTAFDADSVLGSLIGSIYALFAYQCFAVR